MSEEFNVMKSVYCYPFPEVWDILVATEGVIYNNNSRPLFMTQTPVEKAKDILAPLNLRPALDIPKTSKGKVNLDLLHFPVLERDVVAYRRAIPALKEFPNAYPASGSSEAIYHMLAEVMREGQRTIYVLKGEYEGYGEYALSLIGNKEEVDLDSVDPKKQKSGVYFISNPSARDGNIIPNEQINAIAEARHQIYLDLAYVGSTRDYAFDVSHPNIRAVFLSWSKPYGMFRLRVGAVFTRKEVKSLYAQRWFKDDGRMLLGLKVAEEVGPHMLHPLYAKTQSGIIENINTQFGLGMRRSDALLLGHLKDSDIAGLDGKQQNMIDIFRRGDGYRFCLTPYFEMAEKE